MLRLDWRRGYYCSMGRSKPGYSMCLLKANPYLSQLTTLLLINSTAIIMADDDSMAIALSASDSHSQSHLSYRHLPPSRSLSYSRSLIHLAKYFLRLPALATHLDVAAPIPSPSEGIPPLNSRTLHLGYSTISSVKPVVLFLDHSFSASYLFGGISDTIDDPMVTKPPEKDIIAYGRKYKTHFS